MKKTLLATAILGAMSFAAVAQAAPTVYGNIQLAVDVTGNKNTDTTKQVGAMTAFDNGSTLGFKGEEALDNGLTAIYKAEFEFNAGAQKGRANEATKDSAGAVTGYNTTSGLTKGDQAYLGLKGDFGTVRVGSFDTLANDFVQDIVGNPEALGYSNAFGAANSAKEYQQVQYVGDFGAFKLGASVMLNEITDAAKKVAAADDANKKRVNAMQIAVSVPVDTMTFSAVMDTVEGDIGLGFKMPVSDFTVAANFQTGNKGTTKNTKVADATSLNASAYMNYAMGTAYVMFTSASGGDKDTSALGVGATYNLGKNVYTFAEFGSGDADKAESLSGAYLGAVVAF